jgi:hypothetical protein
LHTKQLYLDLGTRNAIGRIQYMCCQSSHITFVLSYAPSFDHPSCIQRGRTKTFIDINMYTIRSISKVIRCKNVEFFLCFVMVQHALERSVQQRNLI